MLWLAVSLVIAAEPQTLVGRAVGVHDGDTITVLDADNVQHKIRLAGIDAPELKQAFGSKAKQGLSGMVAGRDVRIAWRSRDRYGRILGEVYAGGRWVNREMVEAGLAWHYVRFDQSAELRIAEHFARDNIAGLWVESDPVPPWEWRVSRRELRPDRRRSPGPAESGRPRP